MRARTALFSTPVSGFFLAALVLATLLLSLNANASWIDSRSALDKVDAINGRAGPGACPPDSHLGLTQSAPSPDALAEAPEGKPEFRIFPKPNLDPGSIVEPTAPPVVLAIFVAAGLRVAARAIAKHFSERSAKAAITNIAQQAMKKVGRNCFSVRGVSGERVLLAMDKVTILFAGDHDVYERKIKDLCH